MAITGRFVADFSDFDAACKQAEVELKGLETGSERVEKSLNRMVDQFSGRKLIQDANLMVEAVQRLGGASALTEKELQRVSAKASEAAEKMRALGMTVPPGIDKLATATKGAGVAATATSSAFSGLAGQLAGMFTIGSIISFGKATIDLADSIQKMTAQTGMSAEEVQKLMHISADTSVSMGSLVSASQNLELALGRGDVGVIGAIKGLGINFDAFLKLTPYERMVQLASGIRSLEDPTKQADAAADTFGRTWKEILPAIKADMDALGEAAPQMSGKNSEAVDEMVDDFGRMYSEGKAKLGDLLGVMIRFRDNITPDFFKKGTGIAESWAQMMNLLDGGAADLAATAAKVTPAVNSMGQAQTVAALSTAELARVTKDLNEKAAASIKANKDREEAAKKAAEAAAKELAEWAEGYERLSAAGLDWQEQVSRHDEQLVEHIQRSLEAGRTVEELAEAFSIAKEDVAAMKRALEEDAAALKRHDAAVSETTSLLNELYTLQIERSGTATEAQIANINLWANEYKARLMEARILTTESENAIDAIRKEKIEALMLNWDTLDAKSQRTLQERADREARTYQFMVEHSERYSTAAIADQEAIARKAQEAADIWSTSFDAAGEAVIRKGHHVAAEHGRAAQQAALSWSQAMEAVRAGEGTMSGTLPQGGPGTMTNYGEWGSPGHKAAVARAYAAGRYFGPVKTRGGGSSIYSAGNQSYDVDWDALGMAKGGPVSAGAPYMVGEKGPELFVPSSSGDIVPNGAGGAMTNVFNINGTGADVARVVVSELTRLMRTGRKWPAV